MHDTKVINAGIPGHNSRDLLGRIDKDVIAHKPDLVCLMVGTNDMLNSRNSVPFGEYKENFQTIVKTILDCASKLLLILPPPAYDSYVIARHEQGFFNDKKPNDKLNMLCTFLKGFSKENNIPLADVNTVFKAVGMVGTDKHSLVRNEENAGTPDGVHPTAHGYQVFATVVLDAIRHNNLPIKNVVCFGDSITFGQYVEGEGTTEGCTYPAFLKAGLQLI